MRKHISKIKKAMIAVLLPVTLGVVLGGVSVTAEPFQDLVNGVTLSENNIGSESEEALLDVEGITDVTEDELIENTDGDLSWWIDENGVLTVKGSGDYTAPADWLACAQQIKSARILVKNITNTSGMFMGCSNLESVDMTQFDTSQVTDMSFMFTSCSSLKSIDLSNLNTAKVTTMCDMFSACCSLTTIDVSKLETGNVTNMSYMFHGCSGLTTLDLSALSVPNVSNMTYMLEGCNNLQMIIMPADQKCNIDFPFIPGMAWRDENGTAMYTAAGAGRRMIYTRMVLAQMGQKVNADSVTERKGKIPKKSSFTITGNTPGNMTVAFDGVDNVNAKAVSIPEVILIDGVEYAVTTVSPEAFDSKKDQAKFTVTDNRVGSLTVEYQANTNKKKSKLTVPTYSTYKGIKFKVTSVAAKSFKGNKKVSQISIATSVTNIGDSCFEGCTSLKSVTIGKSLKTIGKNAFKNCKKLTKVTIKSTKLQSVGKNALKGVNAKCKIKVPKKSLKKYQKLFKNKGQEKSVKVVK